MYNVVASPQERAQYRQFVVRPLPRLQRNRVFEFITAAGLEPTDFDWVDVAATTGSGNRLIVGLLHKPSGFYFYFDGYTEQLQFYFGGGIPKPEEPPEVFQSVYCPGERRPIEEVKSNDWAGQLDQCRKWVSLLAAQLGEPDLWDGLASPGAVVTGTVSEAKNEPFKPEEVQKLRSALVEIEAFAKAQAADRPESLSRISARIRYLDGALDRLHKIDWLNAFAGA